MSNILQMQHEQHHTDATRATSYRCNTSNIIQICNTSHITQISNLLALKDLDHEVGIDHTDHTDHKDHTDHLSDV